MKCTLSKDIGNFEAGAEGKFIKNSHYAGNGYFAFEDDSGKKFKVSKQTALNSNDYKVTDIKTKDEEE